MKIECDTYDFAERLTDLRIQKGVSARDMSLSMGQTSSYINNIENKSNLPSMKAFFCICEYLEITPLDFFNYDDESLLISNELIKEIRMLNTNQANLIYKILKAHDRVRGCCCRHCRTDSNTSKRRTCQPISCPDSADKRQPCRQTTYPHPLPAAS